MGIFAVNLGFLPLIQGMSSCPRKFVEKEEFTQDIFEELELAQHKCTLRILRI
jgi:hypothetical protein